MEKEHRINRKLREAVYERDGLTCQYCNKKVILTKDIRRKEDYLLQASIDHVIPRNDGGEDSMENCVTACRSCNSRKKDNTVDELKFLDLNNGDWTRIANSLILAFARTKLNTQETRIIFAIIHKTYGYNKPSDWVSNSQLEEITGIHRCHCANTITRLKERNIVTKTGNKIKLNKYYFNWRGLPKQVTKEVTNKTVPKQVIGSTQTGNQLVPKQVPTKDNITKENNTKEKKKIKEKRIHPFIEFKESVKSKGETYKEMGNHFTSKGNEKEYILEVFEKFILWWDEDNYKTGKKRYEDEDTFSVKSRLSTFFNRRKFNN